MPRLRSLRLHDGTFRKDRPRHPVPAKGVLREGELELDGVKLDLGKVKTPIYVQSSRDDHIAPFKSIYRGAKLFGGPVKFTMAATRPAPTTAKKVTAAALEFAGT